jgi:4-amino-4-deoxy-L-arabinose transferase-like glycosyltransferase
MPLALLKRLALLFFLSFLMVSAFSIRFENFKRTTYRSIDEIVYYRLGKQVKDNFSNYNTIEYAKELTAQGRSLPQYFYAPLFKHPPLYPILISLSMRIFGDAPVSAAYVSLLMSVLMIPLIYLLGKMLVNRFVGVIAAVYLWMDPVSIMCSQKMWMETTLSYFMLLSIVFFILALKQRNNFYFILAAVASGLAALAKYPGVIVTAGYVFYAFLYDRELFKNKLFKLGLIVPLIVLIPWLVWNFGVYGMEALTNQGNLHEDAARVVGEIFNIKMLAAMFVLFVVTALLVRYSRIFKQNSLEVIKADSKRSLTTEILSSLLLVGFFILVFPSLQRTFDFQFLPETSWSTGAFANEPPAFYFHRLIEYSFLYFLAFLYLLAYPKQDKTFALLRVSAVTIFSFYILWRNYQCRYILAVLPLLIVFGVIFIYELFQKIESINPLLPRMLAKFSLLTILALSILKLQALNSSLSFTNNFCYF